MGRGTQTEAGTGTTLLYGAPMRRGVVSPVDRVRHLAIRKPEIAWTYLVELIERGNLSREDEREALRAIAAADVDALYSGIESEPRIAHIPEEAWREERDYIEATWPAHLLPSAASGAAKPEDPGHLVFHRPTIGFEGFGPIAVLSMPDPTDEWALSIADGRRQTLASCLSGNLEKTPLGASVRRQLVDYLLDSDGFGDPSRRCIAERIAGAQMMFGEKDVLPLDENELTDLQTAVAQDLFLSFGYLRETWAQARERVSTGNGGRAASEIFIRRVMRLHDGVEPGHVYAAFTPEQRKAVGEAFFTAKADEFRPFFEGLKLAVAKRLEARG